MRSLPRLLMALLLCVLAGSWLATPAHADDDDTPRSWRIQRHFTDVTFDKNGVGKATTTIDFDFSDDKGHGPFLVFSQRSRIPGDPDHWRKVDVQVDKVSSPTNAPVDLKTESESGFLKVRVGHPDKTVTGVQTYVIEYTVRGVVQPQNQTSQLDEVNWNVIGTGWQVPINNGEAVIHLPAAPERTACFTGKKLTEACEASQDGTTVIYKAGLVDKGEGLQVVAGMPIGSLVDVQLETSKRYHLGNTFPLNPATGAGAAALAAAGTILVALRVRRNGRDEVYEGLTPGLAPLGAAQTATARSGKAEVAVQFAPPAAVQPGEIGTLIDSKADKRDVVATLVDLAVRGHLSIQSTGKKSFTFRREHSDAPMAPFEQKILKTFLKNKDFVTTDDLSKESYAKAFPNSANTLYNQVTKERGWFKKSPQKAREEAAGVGIAVVLLGALVTVGLAFLGWGLLGLAICLVGLVMLIASPWMPARTADGSAVLAQARGFELYLRTAEADQLRWEEGEDIFSKYLPWAIGFGVADRWVGLFKQLAEEGRYDMGMASGWYYGSTFGDFSSLSNLDSSMASAMDAASSAASSSGSSGFSGGGGFGGGGGGGW